MKLITHSGCAHADDLMAYTVLSVLYPEHQLIRTRDENIIHDDSEPSIVFDVGLIYNDMVKFDHHQKNGPVRANGIPYSSFGLIWKRFGGQYLKEIGVPVTSIGETKERVEETFVKYIDIGDTGYNNEDTAHVMHPNSFGRIIHYILNDGTDESFIEASQMTKKLFKNLLTINKKLL
jgi:uncharacterized UPF0160 family protein